MSAILSDCRRFRFVLHRKTKCPLRWIKPMVFVMINPSTADETINDRTIEKCIKIAENNGHTDIYVVNLFPLRTKDVKEVDHYMANTAASEYRPIDEQNFVHIDKVVNMLSATVICAWGKYDKIQSTWAQAMIFFRRYKDIELYCLGVNKDGSPKHPLFLSAKTELIRLNSPI